MGLQLIGARIGIAVFVKPANEAQDLPAPAQTAGDPFDHNALGSPVGRVWWSEQLCSPTPSTGRFCGEIGSTRVSVRPASRLVVQSAVGLAHAVARSLRHARGGFRGGGQGREHMSLPIAWPEGRLSHQIDTISP